MVDQVLSTFFIKGPGVKSRLGRVFLNREKQLFAMNLGQDFDYHAETHLSDIL